MSRRRLAARIGFALLVVASLAVAATGALGAGTVSKSQIRDQAALPDEERSPIAPPTDGTTVVTTSPRKSSPGALLAFGADGRLRYYNGSHDKYFDVDPVPDADGPVVEYTAGTYLDERECPYSGFEKCILVVIERANLDTGETERLVERYTTSGIWHDADRINDTHYVVSDIDTDRVFVVDIEADVTRWAWDAGSDYPPESGGFVSDWTHTNDVEALPDGRVMVSLRNQDQVAFLDEDGLQPEWTLGSDDKHATLYEQHNPDYIPTSRGGPAVLVADSENSRLVEYQRRNGSWDRTWTWSDDRLTWPRDADRLPDGRTLAVDSNGGRVVEIAPNGSVVWSVGVDTPYDAERLGTGDESAGGEAATSLGLAGTGTTGGSDGTDRARTQRGPLGQAVDAVQALLPSLLVNGILFILPAWVTPQVLFGVLGSVFVLAVWGAVELRWSDRYVEFSVPVRFGRHGD